MIFKVTFGIDFPDDFVDEVGSHRIDVLVGYVVDLGNRILTRAYREAKGVCCEKKKTQKKKIW